MVLNAQSHLDLKVESLQNKREKKTLLSHSLHRSSQSLGWQDTQSSLLSRQGLDNKVAYLYKSYITMSGNQKKDYLPVTTLLWNRLPTYTFRLQVFLFQVPLQTSIFALSVPVDVFVPYLILQPYKRRACQAPLTSRTPQLSENSFSLQKRGG